MKMLIDTNVLLDYPSVLKKYEAVLPITVIEELDSRKSKDFRARRALRAISNSKVEFISKEVFSMPDGWDPSKNDNKIIMCAKENNLGLITNDTAVLIKCLDIGIPALEYHETNYTGVVVLEGSTLDINRKFLDFELIENQYIIVRNTDTNEETEMVFRNGNLQNIILPPSHVIKGLNAYQRCALDLLMSDTPIKIILGETGSGKTKLAAEVGYYRVAEEREFEKMVIVRNPKGSGEEIGHLPGSFEEKTDSFFLPIINNLGRETTDDMITRKQLEKQIPFFAKGLTYLNSFILVDEAEDLDLKTLKLIGSRTGKNSCIVFSGDYAQAENKFLSDNGLIRLINETKGNPLVGIVVLQEDVRSSASKVFADLR